VDHSGNPLSHRAGDLLDEVFIITSPTG